MHPLSVCLELLTSLKNWGTEGRVSNPNPHCSVTPPVFLPFIFSPYASISLSMDTVFSPSLPLPPPFFLALVFSRTLTLGKVKQLSFWCSGHNYNNNNSSFFLCPFNNPVRQTRQVCMSQESEHRLKHNPGQWKYLQRMVHWNSALLFWAQCSTLTRSSQTTSVKSGDL